MNRSAATCLLFVFMVVAGCAKSNEYPNRPITLVCPWAAGGGTDRVSRQMAAYLEKELGQPVNVINATGGKGVTGHSRGLLARPDGYTITMATLELNMMHWSGLTKLTHDSCIPIMSLNEDYAALFVRTDAKWQTLHDLQADIKSRPGEITASGTASGGAWHLALAGWLLSQDIDVTDVPWISSKGSGPAMQELASGGVDIVCCSLPEAATLMEMGELRSLGVMAPKRATGFEDVPTFKELGVDWELGGWRGLALPPDTPPEVVDRIVDAATRITSGETTLQVREKSREGDGVTREQTFPEYMQSAGFDNTSRGPAEFKQFLIDNDAKFGKLLTLDSMRAVNSDPYNPLLFPGILGAIACVLGVAIGAVRLLGERAHDEREESSTTSGKVNFVLIVSAIVAYVLFAEHVGFVIAMACLLFLMLWRFKTQPVIALVIAGIFTVVVYQSFSYGLRVPLPHGWLGW